MTDLGLTSYFLGLEVKQCDEGIYMSQRKYTSDLLERLGMHDCNPMKTPMNTNPKFSLNDGEEKVDAGIYRSLVESLLYLTNSRLDIMQATSLLSRFMQSPSELHYGATKRVLRYVKGTCSYGLWYTNTTSFELCGFSDSDWAGSVDDRRSTTGYVFNIGSAAIAWSSKKQPSPVLSSSEAEYITVTSTACQAVWLRRILEDMKQHKQEATIIHRDNQSTIAMTKNPMSPSRTRHHFIRELVDKGSIKMSYCGTDDQLTDIFTKPVPSDKFIRFRDMLARSCKLSALRGSVRNNAEVSVPIS
jgi:hypothetical protein